MKFKTVKGARDFYPQDMAVRNWIFDAWQRVSRRHGFEEYDGPIFEYLDLFRAKSGDEIVDQLFHFEDRGGRELAIRAEMTPTLARMVAAQANALPRPIKWFSVPRLCRAERPQRGRTREFFQWNIDIVGTDDVIADAECLFVAIDLFQEFGLTADDFEMRINSRALLSELLKARGFAEDRHPAIYAVLDKRDKLASEAYEEQLSTITSDGEERNVLHTIVQARGDEGLAELASLVVGNERAEAELARLRRLFDLLEAMGVRDCCTYDMGIVRGLAYYTGVVFEGFGKGGLQRAICGGGRYDELLKTVGGPAMSGIGFGTSDVVILDLLNDRGRLPAEARVAKRVDFFVIDADAELFDTVLEIVARLRKRGFAAEFNYRRQAIGKQFKQASNQNARYAVIVGSEYTERQAFMVKDLGTGEQREVPAAEFLAAPSTVVSPEG